MMALLTSSKLELAELLEMSKMKMKKFERSFAMKRLIVKQINFICICSQTDNALTTLLILLFFLVNSIQ